ncbi:MAG: exo-alpha-sialidase [Deltaproteobacteria bacterium]|nr:exo-alpha-sialidase [Deltaproteobacteria bacterium]
MRLEVGIGEHGYVSRDGGRSWEHGERDLAAAQRGFESPLLPAAGERARWAWLEMRAGLGVAVRNERIRKELENRRRIESLAHVFLSSDSGATWRECDLAAGLGPEALERIGCSWPAEAFSDVFVLPGARIALFWEDPWLYDWPDMHVIHSGDGGAHWGYACLGDPCPVVAADPDGRLLAINHQRTLVSLDGGASWNERVHKVKWPVGCPHEKVPIPRHVCFVAPGEAYALVVHWHANDVPRSAPDVGLVRTIDDARTWKHVHVFENLDTPSVNSYGVLALKVSA